MQASEFGRCYGQRSIWSFTVSSRGCRKPKERLVNRGANRRGGKTAGVTRWDAVARAGVSGGSKTSSWIHFRIADNPGPSRLTLVSDRLNIQRGAGARFALATELEGRARRMQKSGEHPPARSGPSREPIDSRDTAGLTVRRIRAKMPVKQEQDPQKNAAARKGRVRRNACDHGNAIR